MTRTIGVATLYELVPSLTCHFSYFFFGMIKEKKEEKGA